MDALAALFARQDGLASTVQLHRAGASRGLIRQRLPTGEWERLGSGVVGPAGAPPSWRRQVRAALLSVGEDAAVSGPSAARLHGFDGFGRADQIDITTFHRRHHTPPPGVVLHRSSRLTRRDCVDLDGICTVSRPIALIQVAASGGRSIAAQALDGLLRDGANPLWIERVATAWRRQGSSGPRIVLDLLHERVNQRLPRSWFQRLAKSVLAATGLHLVDEHPVRESGKLLAELDLAIPHLKIGIECQSWSFHSTPSARAADTRRKRRLRMLGWELVEVWWADLSRIDEVAAEIGYLIEQRS